MSHPAYKNIGLPQDRLIEECSELIQAVCKAVRFGLDNSRPGEKTTNRQSIIYEMEDVERAIAIYKADLISSLLCSDCNGEGGRAMRMDGTIHPTECGACGRLYDYSKCELHNSLIKSTGNSKGVL